MRKQEIVQAIHDSTAEVFSTMLGLAVVPGPVQESQTCPSVSDGVISFVGLSGSWVGSGVISCNAGFACRLYESLLMTEATCVNEEVLDAFGEMANMIIGNFKTAAETVLGPLGLSVPTVIYGTTFLSKSLGCTDWIVMPFACGKDDFEIRISFTPANKADSVRQNLPQQMAIA